MNATCIVLTQNENLDVQELSQVFSEVILVVDAEERAINRKVMGSSKVTTLFHPLMHNFAAQRNFALKHATYDWALFLDDDESISAELLSDLERAILLPEYQGYFLSRTDIFMGRELKHGETASVRLLRFARRNSGVWTRPVHEVWDVKGAIGVLKHPLVHQAHRSIHAFMEKLNRYTKIEADHRRASGKRMNIFELLAYPLVKFIANYLLKLGFLDGFPGLAMAYMMSLHSLMVRVYMYEKN